MFDNVFSAEESRMRDAYERRNSDRYSRFNAGHLYMVQMRERNMLKLLAESGYKTLHEAKILEVGCGHGDLLRDFIKWGARPKNITGIDLLPDRVSEAVILCPPGVDIRQGNSANLPMPDGSFDLVFQSTVFTSVLDRSMRTAMAREMMRVVKPNGLILWYDYHFDNPRNPDVRGVRRREIFQLFPACRVRLKRTTLAPPISYALAPYSWLLCYLLERAALFCTHYVAAIRKE